MTKILFWHEGLALTGIVDKWVYLRGKYFAYVETRYGPLGPVPEEDVIYEFTTDSSGSALAS